jgi:LysR family hca operon transcriptional activator
MEAEMKLRHLRYFVAVAEESSLTLAAEKRLHTAQPSLSRQIRDLEYEVGVSADDTQRARHRIHCRRSGLSRPCTASAYSGGRRHGGGATRGATAAEVVCDRLPHRLRDGLVAVMEILRAELPSTEVIIHSQDSPDRAGGLTYEKIGLASCVWKSRRPA